MKKKFTVLTLCAMLFALCSPTDAQQPAKIWRIGYLSSGNTATDSARTEGIRLALGERGYIEGQNIAIEYRYGEGKRDRFADFAAEMVRLKVDLIILAGADRVIRAAMSVTKTIPIVMAGTGTDPVKAGFVESLAHPGGNVTGITNLGGQLGGKRLELLKEAVGKVIHVAVLYDPANPSHAHELKEELPPAARTLKLTLQPWELPDANSLERVFAVLSKQRPDGLYVLGGPLMRDNQKQIVGFALKSRVPSMFFTRAAVDDGGLMSYGADVEHSYQRVAYYVDRILKGAKPAGLPVEQPTKFEFVINLKTAKQIGLTIPPEVLARATKLIK